MHRGERDFPGRRRRRAGLLIRAPFHEAASAGGMEVVVMPRMSFGTGHHATTWLMARAVLDLGVVGRGASTWAAARECWLSWPRNAARCMVDAVDIDDWADGSCRENIAANGVAEQITPLLGDVRRIAGRSYDFILANINRNILLADMPAYAAALTPGGDLLMSGFLEQDIPVITEAAAKLGMMTVATANRDGWMLVHVKKVS